jgi:hypothetical protein
MLFSVVPTGGESSVGLKDQEQWTQYSNNKWYENKYL